MGECKRSFPEVIHEMLMSTLNMIIYLFHSIGNQTKFLRLSIVLDEIIIRYYYCKSLKDFTIAEMTTKSGKLNNIPIFNFSKLVQIWANHKAPFDVITSYIQPKPSSIHVRTAKRYRLDTYRFNT